MDLEQHNTEIQENEEYWNRKPLIREIYKTFHRHIAENLSNQTGITVEIGSGMAKIKETIPNCICTDIFSNPGIDQVENAYNLSFDDNSLSNIIAIDVFHHLRYPGTALNEWCKKLQPGGSIVLIEPGMGILGRLVYSMFHHEPTALKEPITWFAPSDWNKNSIDYYAAQGNAHRVFLKREFNNQLSELKIKKCEQQSSLSYVASGGLSGRQLYPTNMLPLMQNIDALCNLIPKLFCTRMMIVLEKTR